MGVEDPDEACHEGWQEGGLWQGGDGEGEARAEDREGFPSCCTEEEHLSREPVVLHDLCHGAHVAQSPGCAASRGHSAEVVSSGGWYARPLRHRHLVSLYVRGAR